MTLPAWLQQLLEQTGRNNPDAISRAARAGICHTCGTHIIRALDDDPMGLAVTADPQPLDPTGEALALIDGRATYRLRWTITGTPAGHQPDPRRHGGHVHVVATHRCGTRLPTPTNAPTDPRPQRTAASTSSTPEF